MNARKRSNGSGSPQETVKLGLALSGGGLRASFFHIGLLAQLAMQGLLRQIEVISTVSGGSIIGALYYLHVKRLLEKKPDNQITDQDYKALVESIEQDFFQAVKSNLRLSTFADWRYNLRTMRPDYSHSDRIAALYDEWLYRPVFDAGGSGPVEMRRLKIQPAGHKAPFYPREDNGTRAAKVPILVINATTLNTGHNWQFTASRMGEPPRDDPPVRLEIDKKPIRLRRPASSDGYDVIVPHQRDFSLGHAVAASAAVPGIFHPLAISGFYADDFRVQLVDGGVHDNQGMQGLLDEGCTHFIVSDASQQMEFEDEPATEIKGVLERSFSIVQDRIREEQLIELFQIKPNPRIAFMHLRKGLSIAERAWVDPATGQPAEPDQVRHPVPVSSAFDVDGRVQDLLSMLRTDLDSFTEVEASSLMLDGYLVAGAVLPQATDIAALIPAKVQVDEERWRFHRIAPWLANPSEQYLEQLGVAKQVFFKVFYLIQPKWLGFVSRIALVLGVLALLVLIITLLWDVRPSLGALLGIGVLIALFYVSRRKLEQNIPGVRLLQAPIDAVKRFVGRALPSVLLAPILQFHLKFIDPRFLKLGEIDRLETGRSAEKGRSGS
jgi:predicted acylesterase/phospholipase RssA